LQQSSKWEYLRQRNIFSVFSLGPEWDSSDEEGATPVAVTKTSAGDKKAKRKAVDKKNKSSKTQPPQLQVEEENLEDNNSNTRENDKDLVLYIGHLPKEFEEQDLMSFVSQFGKVHNCRVSRKLETGNSKGYAFVRFGDPEVCQIVCDTLHGYFLGRQRLVCQVRPASRGMFYNTETVIQQRKQQRALKQKQRNRNLASAEKLKEITARLVSREQKKRKQLAEMGIEYDFPGYKCNQEALQVELEEDDSNTKKERKRSDSVGSDGSSSKKNKKKRKESIDSVGSASKRARKDSVDSVSSASKKKSKRKESIDSVSSKTKDSKKSTRKNSVDSEGSAKKEKKRSNSDASNLSEEPSPPASNERMPHSAKKAKKNKKDKKRRQSAP
jgi:nucleolar protein 15